MNGEPQAGGLVVPAGITLLVGGARSGKSALAVRLGRSFSGPVTFVATATAGDDDMVERIQRHQDERPSGWTTIESPSLVADFPLGGMLIIDCITLWVANVLFTSAEVEPTHRFEQVLADRAATLLLLLRQRTGPTIIVTNEVGLGIVPDSPLTRTYRDALGRVNSQLAEAADRSMFLAAGRVLPLLSLTEVFT